MDKQAFQEFKNDELSAAKEKDIDAEFDWVLPEKNKSAVIQLDEHRKEKKTTLPKKHTIGPSNYYARKNEKNIINIIKSLPLGVIGIIVSAIIVGTSFGFMMLSVFSGDELQPLVGDTVKQQEVVPASTTVVNKMSLPTLSTYVVQGGAFSVIEKGKEISSSLKNKGYAATLTRHTEPAYMFIGVAMNKDSAQLIGDIYHEVGQDIYIKPFTVQTEGVLIHDLKGEVIHEIVKLYQELAQLAVTEFSTEDAIVTEDQLKEFSERIALLKEQNSVFQDNDEHYSFTIAFIDQLTLIREELSSYKTNPEQSRLWNIQQQLLEFLVTYEDFVNNA